MSLGPAYGDGFAGTANQPGPGGSFLYVKGSEFVDGSIRLTEDLLEENVEAQQRIDGVWNDTGLQVAESSLHMRNLLLSSAGKWLRTVNTPAGQNALIPHSDFDPTGTTGPTTPYVGPVVIRSVRQSDMALEVVGMTITDIYAHPANESVQIWSIMYIRTGSVGGTAPVEITLRRDDANGAIFWQQILPTFAFASPSTEVAFPLEGLVQVDPGTSTHIEFTSGQNISLESSAGGSIFFAVDLQELGEESLLTESFVLGNDLAIAFDNNANLVRHNFVFSP